MHVRGAIGLLTVLGSLSACSGSEAEGPELSDYTRESDQSPEQSLPARWWAWAESAGNRNPISDRTGKDCGVNQPDDVWFLAGTFGGSVERSCTVPANQPIFFPVMNSICEVVEDTEVERALDECDPEARETSASLDGDDLEVVSLTSEGSFIFEAGPASVIAVPSSRFEAVAGGRWVGPITLTSGRHLLEFAARSDEFHLEVTYSITVK